MAEDQLSLAFGALADPTRRAILARLAKGPATAGELADPFDISRPAVSQHLKVLERANLITRTVNAQWRTLTLQKEPLDAVSAWIEQQRVEWNLRLDALEQHLDRLTHPARSAQQALDERPPRAGSAVGRDTNKEGTP